MPPKPSKMTWQERDAWERGQRAMIDTKLVDVAQAIGFTLDTSQGRSAGTLVQGVRQIAVFFDGHQNRLVFSGLFSPELQDRRIHNGAMPDPECRITVNPDRPADQIAGAIRRNLLPVYEILFKTLSERHQVVAKAEREKAALAAQLAASGRGEVLNVGPYARPDPLRHPRAVFGATGVKARQEPYGSAEVSDYMGLHVTMTLHYVPPELAVFIASLFGEYAEDEEETV